VRVVISRPGRLAGIVIIEPVVHADDRGFFLETFHADAYGEAGISSEFVQANHSRSVVGTVRGLHYQAGRGQPKLVQVIRGAVYDVALDIRPESPTFGAWEAFELDDVKHEQVYIPEGFAHGFCVMSPVADVVYQVGSYYDPDAERGVAWDDPDLAIPWPTATPVVSDRDRRNPRFAALRIALGSAPDSPAAR
jgi:dTDP-4-dehydrorhamnose 3,5-epimerase